MKYFLALLCLFPYLAQAQFALVSSETDDSIKIFLKDTEDHLPPSMKLGINKKITVRFKELKMKNKTVWGQVVAVPFNTKKTSIIDLNSKLLENIKTKERYDFAKATLLHEISHIYDFQNKTTGHEKEMLEDCSKNQSECQKVKNKKFSISDSPLFLSISSWQKKGPLKRYDQSNKLQIRRADIYEDASPQETFAVNMEHYLLDPEFKCRKPSIYSYLEKALNHTPFPGEACDIEYRLPQAVYPDGSIEPRKALDPSRLYQVHYLFAGQGKKMMSRWGHAMIRLVMCAPERKSVDEKCLQDRAHHLILSFRANITDYKVDYLQGLTGKYRSKMFIMPLIDVVKEYTIGELRELRSIPLTLNDEQKDRLVAQVLERFWGYESKYYFITNNCADETLNLLRNVYLDIPEIMSMEVTTPLALKKKFEKLGIANTEAFNNLEEAKNIGLYFESLAPKLKRVFHDLINANVLPESAKDFEKYLNETTTQKRSEIALKITDPGLLGKLIFIEETIIKRKALQMQKTIAKELDKQDHNENGGDLLVIFQRLQELTAKRSGLDLKVGYGLPLSKDHIFTESLLDESDEKEMKKAQLHLIMLVKEKFPQDHKELQEMYSLKQTLFNKMLNKN